MGYVIGLLSAVFWGMASVVIKRLLEYFTPAELAIYRYLISGLFFLVWALVTGKKFKFSKDDWIRLTGASLLGITFYAVISGISLKYLSASLAGILNGLIPILTLLFDRLIRKNALNNRVYFGLLLSIVGVGLISVFEGGESANIVWGTFLMIVALIGWVIFSFTSERLNKKHGSITILAAQSLIGSIVLIPFAYRDLMAHAYYLSNPMITRDILLMSLVISGGGYACYMIGVQKTNIQFMSFVMNLIPVVSLISASIVLGENITVLDVIGLSMILFSVWYVAPKKKRQRSAPSIE